MRSSVGQVFRKILNSALLLGLGTFLGLALVSHHPTDNGWTSISSDVHDTVNLMGVSGAWLSDVFFTFLGLATWLIPLFFIYELLNLWILKNTTDIKFRIISIIFCFLSLATFFALFFDASAANFASQGGIIGNELAKGTLGGVGRWIALILVGLFTLFTFTFSFGINWKNLFKFFNDSVTNPTVIIEKPVFRATNSDKTINNDALSDMTFYVPEGKKSMHNPPIVPTEAIYSTDSHNHADDSYLDSSHIEINNLNKNLEKQIDQDLSETSTLTESTINQSAINQSQKPVAPELFKLASDNRQNIEQNTGNNEVFATPKITTNQRNISTNSDSNTQQKNSQGRIEPTLGINLNHESNAQIDTQIDEQRDEQNDWLFDHSQKPTTNSHQAHTNNPNTLNHSSTQENDGLANLFNKTQKIKPLFTENLINKSFENNESSIDSSFSNTNPTLKNVNEHIQNNPIANHDIKFDRHIESTDEISSQVSSKDIGSKDRIITSSNNVHANNNIGTKNNIATPTVQSQDVAEVPKQLTPTNTIEISQDIAKVAAEAMPFNHFNKNTPQQIDSDNTAIPSNKNIEPNTTEINNTAHKVEILTEPSVEQSSVQPTQVQQMPSQQAIAQQATIPQSTTKQSSAQESTSKTTDPTRDYFSQNKGSRAMATAAHRANLSPLPPIDLLEKPDPNRLPSYSREELLRLSELLEIKLGEFNIKATVVNALMGPVVTRFEVDLSAGIKVSKVTGIARDLARSLSMASVRVVEVIPGKPYIGIEVPNHKREMVRLYELVTTPAYKDPKAGLSMAIGKNIGGKPVITDLAKAPHMLVAGTTGSGKSVAVNCMLLSLLLKYTPEELRLILIDPKQLELANYNDIPHLLAEVVTDMKDAASALNWCVNEMERRYKLMAFLKVRKLSDYNKKIKAAEETGEDFLDPLWRPNDSVSVDKPPRLKPLPAIVVVADEFADMIMQVGKQAEELITRLAQKSRAAGIHLILATQRPSVDVITGLIKANIPTRVALRVNSKVDSRTILDTGGAEDMLGNGDMLFLGPGQIEPSRAHGAYISDNEVNTICDAWRERGSPDYIEDMFESFDIESSSSSGGKSSGGTSGEEDVFFDEAVAFVMETKKVSASSIQRKFSIGYNRAARIVDAMESAGLVSPMGKSGKREILM